jgi:hypothetical protein
LRHRRIQSDLVVARTPLNRVSRERHAAGGRAPGGRAVVWPSRDSPARGVMSSLRRRSRRMTATAWRGLAAVDWTSGRAARDATTSDKGTITYEVRTLMRRQGRRGSGRGEPDVDRPARHVPQRVATSTWRDGRATLCNSVLSDGTATRPTRSVGASPTWARTRSPVAWMVGRRKNRMTYSPSTKPP